MNLSNAAGHPALDQYGPLASCAATIAEIDEPLRESAPINFRAAHRLCGSQADGFKCIAYHALWQYLRLADVTRAVRVDGPLFVDAAKRLAHAGRLSRALISGSADYSMLAHLAHGAAQAERAVRFDVLDMCETPLNINAWYGTARGLDVRAIRGDVWSFEPDEPYDLICTHSFLPWHPVERRPALLRRWHDWLQPGGRVCFSNRVSPEAVPFDPRERSERIERMCARTLSELRRLSIPLPCPEPEFVALMREFGKRRQETYPELSLESVLTWIEDAGLVAEIVLDVAAVLPGHADSPVLSGESHGRPRMWFQARRP